jgi:hypothetical protein
MRSDSNKLDSSSILVKASSSLSSIVPSALRFSGKQEDFPVWKARIECYLDELDLLEVVQTADPHDDVSVVASKENEEQKEEVSISVSALSIVTSADRKKAYRIIYLSLPDEVVRSVLSIPRGHVNSLWKCVLARYEKNSRSTQLQLRNELMNCKLKNNESVEDYAARIKQISHRLQDMKVTIDDQSMCHYFLMGLPTEDEATVEALSVMEELDFEQAIIYISSSHERRKLKQSKLGEVEEINFVARNGKSVKCFQCHKFGHIARDCKESGNNNNNETDLENCCDYCGKQGHKQEKCFIKQNADKVKLMKKKLTKRGEALFVEQDDLDEEEY